MLNYFNPPNHNNFSLNVKLTLRLTKAIIHFFFMCIEEQNIIKKERGLKIVFRFLQELTRSLRHEAPVPHEFF